MLNEPFWQPSVEQWQQDLQNQVNQSENSGIQATANVPQGKNRIPCNEGIKPRETSSKRSRYVWPRNSYPYNHPLAKPTLEEIGWRTVNGANQQAVTPVSDEENRSKTSIHLLGDKTTKINKKHTVFIKSPVCLFLGTPRITSLYRLLASDGVKIQDTDRAPMLYQIQATRGGGVIKKEPYGEGITARSESMDYRHTTVKTVGMWCGG